MTNTRKREFDLGQQVLVKSWRPGPDWVPGVITQQLGPVSYLVKLNDGREWKRHIDHIKAIQLASLASSPPEGSPELEYPVSAPLPEEAEPSSQSNSPPSPSPPHMSVPERRYPLRLRLHFERNNS